MPEISPAPSRNSTSPDVALFGPDLQELVEYVGEVLEAPIALITELGPENQTFLAKWGFGRDWTTLEESFCIQAVRQEGVFEVPDAAADPRFADNPLVTGEPHVRFYAGAPVRTDDATPKNALCVLDTHPRVLNDLQRRTLALLARQVEARLALARSAAAHEATRVRRDRNLERAGIATYEWDVQTDRVSGNALLAAFFGLPEGTASVPVETFLRAIHPDDGARNDAAVARAIETGERYEVEYRVVDAESRERTLLSRGDVVRDADGRPQKLLGVALDVTERAAAERALKAERKRFDDVLRLSPTFVTILRGDELRFEYANPAYLNLVGNRPTVGLTLAESQPEAVESGSLGQRYDAFLREVMETGEPRNFSRQLVRYQPTPDSPLEERVLDFVYQPLQGIDGEAPAIFAQGLDVTDQARAEEELAEARRRLDAVLAAAEVGVWNYDPETRAIGADANLATMFGIDPETARHAPAATFVKKLHAEDQDRVAEAFGRAAVTGTPYHVEFRALVDGEVRYLVARGFAEMDESGRVVRMPGAVLDVSDVKAAQEAERVATETFRTVFEQAPDDAIVVMDADRRIVAWNPAAERIMGWRADEAIGQLIDMIFTPEDRANGALMGEIFGAAWNGSAPDERWHLTKDGDRFWGSGTMNALHEADGSVRGYLKVFRDATGRKEKEEAELMRRLGDMVREAPSFVAILEGEDLVFTYANDAYERLVGGRTLLGKPLLEALPEVADQGYFELLDAVRKSGEPFLTRERPVTFQSEPGGPRVERFVDLAYRPARRADGEIYGVIAHGIDVTESVRARQELERTVREAEGFNYAISHDLRTPLRAISSTSSLLIEESAHALPLDQRELLERQRVAVVRMGQLIDGLLQLSRFARAELKHGPIDMTQEAEAVAQLLTGCSVEVQPGMTAFGDPGLIHSVWQNLIGNACKFSPQGGTVWAGQQDGAFFVRDEGVGFDMQYAEKVFEVFGRLVRNDEFPGTGIGLANVKRIVERHGGRVWAESEPGKGSTFWFTLG